MEGKDNSFLQVYWKLLKNNREFRILWSSNILSEFGNWFNFVASLSVIAKVTGGSTLMVAIFLVVEAIPPLVLSPFIGPIVDRYDKKTILQFSSALRAIIVIGLIFTQTEDTFVLMLVITFAKFSFSSFYAPARSAIVPTVMEKNDLVVANGLDGIVFSCMHFFGGAVGGIATGFLGVTGSFIADSLCFVLTVYVTAFLYRPGTNWLVPFADLIHAVRQLFERSSSSNVMGHSAAFQEIPLVENDESDYNQSQQMPLENDEEEDLAFNPTDSVELEQTNSTTALLANEDDETIPDDRTISLNQTQDPTTDNDRNSLNAEDIACVEEQETNTNVKPNQSSVRMFIAGLQFLWQTPYVLAICHFRACLWLSLGLINLENIRAAQTLFIIGENGSISLGLNYVIVGIGMLTTPILARRFGKTTGKGIQIILMLSLIQLNLGAWMMPFAFHYAIFIAGNFIRSGSTSIIHVYTSLILQQVTPPDLLGRIFTMEMTIATFTTCGIQLLGGALDDVYQWDVYQVDTLAAGLALVTLIFWACYFWQFPHHLAQAYDAQPKINGISETTVQHV